MTNRDLLIQVLSTLTGEDITSKLVLKNYDEYVQKVGEAYMARPDYEAQYVPSWKALAKHTEKMYKQTLTRMGVEFTDEDPYEDFDQMKADVEETGVLKIYTGGSDHPVWTEEENWLFRTVHDALSHLAGNHKFTVRGEISSFNRHYKIAPHAARVALFTEIVGQVGAFALTGSFDYPQKVCKLWGFDHDKLGLIHEDEYLKNFDDVDQKGDTGKKAAARFR